MAQSWDGWVLYTASNGHKYHYNHLTHESRWAVDQRVEDHKTEELFEQYYGQGASASDPDEQDRSDRLDAAEAGDEEDRDVDNTTGVLQSSASVSPYAGVGPMTMPTACGREPPRTAGFAGRVSGALGMAMAKVEHSRRHCEGGSCSAITSEWDPELGQTSSKRRGREGWRQSLTAGGGSRSSRCSESCSTSESSSCDSSSSESSSSSSSSSSTDSDSDSDSAAHTVNGQAHRRSRALSTTRRPSSRRSDEKEAVKPPSVPKGGRRTGRLSVVDLRSSSRGRLESPRHRRERWPSRAQKSSRRHYSRQRKVDAKRRSEAYSSMENRGVAAVAAGDGLADLGRKAVASVVKIAFRAILGSWKGVTTAAIKAMRTLQVNVDMRCPGLPVVVTNSSHEESSEAPRTCQPEDEWWGGEQRQGNRAPYRSFIPETAALPPLSSQQQQQQRASHAGGRFTRGVGGRVLTWSERTRGQVVEGFREEGNAPTLSPAGSWVESEGGGGHGVLLEGGTEERKGRLTSSPPSWTKA